MKQLSPMALYYAFLPESPYSISQESTTVIPVEQLSEYWMD